MSDSLLGWVLDVATFLVIAGVALEGAEYIEEKGLSLLLRTYDML